MSAVFLSDQVLVLTESATSGSEYLTVCQCLSALLDCQVRESDEHPRRSQMEKKPMHLSLAYDHCLVTHWQHHHQNEILKFSLIQFNLVYMKVSVCSRFHTFNFKAPNYMLARTLTKRVV